MGHTDSDPFLGSACSCVAEMNTEAIRCHWRVLTSVLEEELSAAHQGGASAWMFCSHMADNHPHCMPGNQATSPPASGCWSSPAAPLMSHRVSIQGRTNDSCLHSQIRKGGAWTIEYGQADWPKPSGAWEV